MNFQSELIEGRLIKRYKRFLADVELADGSIITAHSSNTGSMKGCSEPGSRVWLSTSDNPKRKYPLSWEIIEVKPDVLVCINTLMPNKVVAEAIEQNKIPELMGYSSLRREVKYGHENSRIDLLLEEGEKRCYIEIKNVTLINNTHALFPDAVTKRGTKHLRELIQMVEEGHRAVIFYCIARKDATAMRPATSIDPEYSEQLSEAIDAGVEAMAWQVDVSPQEVKISHPLPVIIQPPSF